MINKEIRRKILEYIFQKDEEKPMYEASKKELIEFLGVDERKVDNNVLYLEDKGYLKLEKTLGSLFNSAQITSDGKDLVEDSNQFDAEFPINITQNIVSNSVGTVIGNEVEQNINIINSFNSIYQEIEKRNPEKKEEIINAVNSIESELKKEKTDRSVIQKSIGFLKQNAGWIIPTIIELVKGSFGI